MLSGINRLDFLYLVFLCLIMGMGVFGLGYGSHSRGSGLASLVGGWLVLTVGFLLDIPGLWVMNIV